MPQEYMSERVLRTASGANTLLPVMGQIPPLASVAAITDPASQVVSMEHNWRQRNGYQHLKYLIVLLSSTILPLLYHYYDITPGGT